MPTDSQKPITVNIKIKRRLSPDHPLYELLTVMQSASPNFGLSDPVATLAFDSEAGIDFLRQYLSLTQRLLADPGTVSAAPVQPTTSAPAQPTAPASAQAAAPSSSAPISAGQSAVSSREAALNALA